MPAGTPDGLLPVHERAGIRLLEDYGERTGTRQVLQQKHCSEVLSHEEPSDDSSLGRGETVVEEYRDVFGFGKGSSDWKFSVFMLLSDRFAVNGYVRVGDHISKVRDMGGAVRNLSDEDGGGRIYWKPGTKPLSDEYLRYYPAFHYDKDGTITYIELYYD